MDDYRNTPREIHHTASQNDWMIIETHQEKYITLRNRTNG